jgi:general secretion pathway protein F
MSDIPTVFEEMTINLVEAGEATGNLKDILPRLTEHYERISEIRSKILAAVAYPAVLMVVAGGVVLFFLYFLLPRMKGLFDALRGEIPWSARILISSSQAMLTYGPFVIAAAIFGIISLWQWRRTVVGRMACDRFLLRLPVVGPFLIGADMLQSTQTLAVLMANGITTIEALRLTANNVTNRALRVAFTDTRVRVAEGASISGALADSPFVPRMDLDLLSIGEQTGNIVPSLRTIASAHQRRQAKQIQAFIGIFSTGVLFFAFTIIGFIAYAIVSAVFGLSASFGSR